MSPKQASNVAKTGDKPPRYPTRNKAVKGSGGFGSRLVVDEQVRLLVQNKKRLVKWMFSLGLISMFSMVVEVEVSLEKQTRFINDDGEVEIGSAGEVVTDVLRTLSVILTLALAANIFQYYQYHKGILLLVRQREQWVWWMLLEIFTVCLGVMPPGVHTEVEIPLLHSLRDDFHDPIVRHISILCLFRILRLPLVIKWLVRLLLSHVKSPAVLSWQHNLSWKPPNTFRVKFLFERYPVRFVIFTTVLTWMMGAYCLRAVEPVYAPTNGIALSAGMWQALYESWIMILDSPPSEPETIPGTFVILALMTTGLIMVAILTASLCNFTELSPNEAWLITQIEQEELDYQKRIRALKLLQATARVWRHAFKMKHGGADGNSAERRRELLLLRAERGEAFHEVRVQAAEQAIFTEVATVATVHRELCSLTDDQDALYAMVAQVAMAVARIEAHFEIPEAKVADEALVKRLARTPSSHASLLTMGRSQRAMKSPSKSKSAFSCGTSGSIRGGGSVRGSGSLRVGGTRVAPVGEIPKGEPAVAGDAVSPVAPLPPVDGAKQAAEDV